MWHRFALLIAIFITSQTHFANRCVADDAAQIALFEQKIRPVLVEHCYECHSERADKLKGGLLLDSKAGWTIGGDSAESVIVPGDPAASLLIQYLRYEDGLEMPPEGKLPDSIIANFILWVKAGAIDPRADAIVEAKRADRTWWSLQPLQKVDEGRHVNESPIDSFVIAKLAKNGLKINPPAEAKDLIRRMSYDVIGLPPTPEEVDAFATDYAENADAAAGKLVDHLLASPHYGEQWGRHWLDVIRFGESIGFERNVIIDDLWPFRDYVINSINADKPFDQFIIEHLAGDVIGKDQPEIEVGTAFLVAGPYDDVGNQDVVAQANIRAATLDDIITATASAFLGLTVNCARCHDHKFDPVPTEDYYRMRAAFEGVTHGRRVVATKQARDRFNGDTKPLKKRQAELNKQLKLIEDAIAGQARETLTRRSFARPKVDPLITEEIFNAIDASFIRLVLLARTDNPDSAVGSRLVEVEVWTNDETPRNVALASVGAVAEGARSAVAEDFPQAYGPQFTIDGKSGEQWFVGNPAELTIRLAKPQTINRVTFSNAKGVDIQDKSQGATPCEYEVQVSMDGETWTTVADSFDREPWSPAHGIERVRRDVITAEQSQEIAARRRELADVQAQLNAISPLPQIFVGNFSQPKEPTRLHLGGDPMKPAAEIAAASLRVLSEAVPPYELPLDAPEGDRRLEFAKWITSDDNPLTARVLANRVWHYHFGTGIVDTPSDLGFLGGEPSHPELLDWLASRLVEGGWRLKPLHREILLSKTYRQSAAFRNDAADVDKDARLLWRFPPRRLSAEEIRDTFLAVAGKLSTTPGGPGFRLYKFTQNNVCTYFPLDVHGPETYRRAVYHQNARASVVDLLTDFDLPDIAFAAPRRANTTTPLQALTLLNHSFTIDMATALAERASVASDNAGFVNEIYRLTLQRTPSDEELSAAVSLVESHGRVSLCRAILNTNEVLYVE